MRLGPTLVNAAVALGALALAGAAAELTTRAVGWARGVDFSLFAVALENPDRLPEPLIRRDPLLGFRLNPNTRVRATTSDFSVQYATNAHGFRDGDYPVARAPGTIRVLALGDSVTFGEGVPEGERFTDIPEDTLEGLEVINTGVPGWGVDQQLVFLASEGIGWRPDYVFFFLSRVQVRRIALAVFSGGQVELPDPVPQREDGVPVPGSQVVARTQGSSQAWWGASHLLSYLYFRTRVAALQNRFAEADRRIWEGIRLDAKRRDREAETAGVQRFFETRVLHLLGAAAQLGYRYGFKVVAVVVDSEDLPFLSEVDPRVTVASLAPVLRQEAEARNLSFIYDPHFNPTTHHLIGQALVDILCHDTPGLSCNEHTLEAVAVAAPSSPVALGPAPAPSLPDAPLGLLRADALVLAAYRGLLGRPPGPRELAWVPRLTERRSASGEMVLEILDLEEFADRWRAELLVAALYVGVLDRVPEKEGFANYVAEVKKGATAGKILQEWSQSPEWSGAYGALSDEEFLNGVAERVLGRRPEAQELAAWTLAASSEGRVAVVERILLRPEARGGLAPALRTILLFLALRGAPPEPERYPIWTSRFNLGEPPANVIADALDELVPW